MASNDALANAISKIQSYEIAGKTEVSIYPSSKIIRKVLDIMNHYNYIGEYKITKTTRGELLNLNLLGRINKCGVIKPRFNVKKDEFEKFERRYLPAKGFGLIIVSTSKGMMTNEEAKIKNVGGKLLAYIY
ncbi:30S ribosomal protein S8 [Candidatus Woesearchaeota archaeon]|nr:30S ribosomal protein S8 [Candidatus Woesearchaeota archaeon]